VSDLYKDVKIALRVKRILIQSHIFLIQIVNLKQDLFLRYTTDNVIIMFIVYKRPSHRYYM